ncbi:VOC family protein [Chitinimonas sp. BJYL2]|uniref:VOC family protein n=1 Tax=Chitinimonas sp. BJYL2 TaxID=2976696 RepID=UPI0022B42073|nr:VOC family protein [Chitinimonas sp. BJYL2]
MSICRLDHYNLWVPADQVETVRAFYCDVLGFEVGPRPGLSSSGYWLYAGGAPLVHVSVRGSDGPSPTGMLNHIAFAATDLDPLLARLHTAGIAYDIKPADHSGQTQLFFRDTCGLRLEINCPTAPSALSK